MQQPVFIPKTRLERVTELLNATLVIRDALDGMKVGKAHQLIPLSGQLRALLTERSKKTKPLLLDLASEFDHSLQVFASPEVKGEAPELLASFGGFTFSLLQALPDLRPIDLPDALDRNVAYVDGKKFKLRKVIEFLANDAGGAHYSKRVPRDLARAVNANVFGSPLQSGICQLGDIVLQLAARLFQRFASFEWHLIVMVPTQERSENQVLLDARFPDSPMAQQVFIDPLGRLHFAIQDLTGRANRLVSPILLPHDRPIHLVLRCELDDRLRFSQSVLLDGHEVGRFASDHPFFVVGDPLEYDVCINGVWKGSSTGELLFGQGVVLGPQTPLEKAEALLHFSEEGRLGDLRFLRLKKGQVGLMPSMSRDIQLPEGVDAIDWVAPGAEST